MIKTIKVQDYKKDKYLLVASNESDFILNWIVNSGCIPVNHKGEAVAFPDGNGGFDRPSDLA